MYSVLDDLPDADQMSAVQGYKDKASRPMPITMSIAFNIEGDGTGLDSAIVTGSSADAGRWIQDHNAGSADPAALANEGIDTTCFIQSVIPQLAANTLSCAPTPEILDLSPRFPNQILSTISLRVRDSNFSLKV